MTHNHAMREFQAGDSVRVSMNESNGLYATLHGLAGVVKRVGVSYVMVDLDGTYRDKPLKSIPLTRRELVHVDSEDEDLL